MPLTVQFCSSSPNTNSTQAHLDEVFKEGFVLFSLQSLARKPEKDQRELLIVCKPGAQWLHYYNVDFTTEQWNKLQHHKLGGKSIFIVLMRNLFVYQLYRHNAKESNKAKVQDKINKA